MKKIDELRRFSNKELMLTKESIGALPKSSEYSGPIRKKSYSYVSGIIGIVYNPFLNEDIRDCFFDYEQTVLLRFWTSRIATIKSAANQQTRLGLVLKEKVAATLVLKSDKRVTREQLRKLDCLKDLDPLETMCKILKIPMEVKRIWARRRLMQWFRANMTAWLYEYAKKHMSKHSRV